MSASQRADRRPADRRPLGTAGGRYRVVARAVIAFRRFFDIGPVCVVAIELWPALSSHWLRAAPCIHPLKPRNASHAESLTGCWAAGSAAHLSTTTAKSARAMGKGWDRRALMRSDMGASLGGFAGTSLHGCARCRQNCPKSDQPRACPRR
mgnify:CR=1 FL=1